VSRIDHSSSNALAYYAPTLSIRQICAWGNRRCVPDWQLVKQSYLPARKEEPTGIDPISSVFVFVVYDALFVAWVYNLTTLSASINCEGIPQRGIVHAGIALGVLQICVMGIMQFDCDTGPRDRMIVGADTVASAGGGLLR